MPLHENASSGVRLPGMKLRTLMLEGKLAASLRSRFSASLPSRVAVIGNYFPRQCGIATLPRTYAMPFDGRRGE
jgi:hypothetical protein